MNNSTLSLFPYCDDSWFLLEPSVEHLTREQFDWRTPGNPSTIGWLLDHVASTEDYWINAVAFGEALVMPEPIDLGDINALLVKHRCIRRRSMERLQALTLAEMQR